MANHTADYKGLRCPQPILKITALSASLPPGDTLDVEADCPTFEDDIKAWCEKVGKVLVSITKDDQGVFKARIQF